MFNSLTHSLKRVKAWYNPAWFVAASLLVIMLAIVLVYTGLPPEPASAEEAEGPMISAGYVHSLALKDDGTVWAWGNNSVGQLGDGTTKNRHTPVQVSGLSGVKTISAGNFHSLALKSDGTVWAWGININGTLGDGTTEDRLTPVQVSGLSGVEAISAGGGHSLALKNDGTIWSWGSNSVGQLGDGTTENKYTPIKVSGLSGVQAISCGTAFSMVLTSDDTVWAWGYNAQGRLGDGTTKNRHTPVQVSGLKDIQAISGGGSYAMALKADGTVWAWGSNSYGTLGDGTRTNRHTPVMVDGLSSTKAVSAGSTHSLALGADGMVWAWGGCQWGQIGDGTTEAKLTPTQSSGLKDVHLISAGSFHSIALGADGTVWAWGSNSYGTLGDRTTEDRHTPVKTLINLGEGTQPPTGSGNYYVDQTLIKGMPLQVRIFSDGPSTPCSIEVFNLKAEGHTSATGTPGLYSTVLTIDDTANWPTGHLPLKIQIGSKTINDSIRVVDANEYAVVEDIEGLKRASTKTMVEMTTYPGRAFLDLLIKGAGLLPVPIDSEVIEGAKLAYTIEKEIMKPLRDKLVDFAEEHMDLMDNEGYKANKELELELRIYKNEMINDIKSYIGSEIGRTVYFSRCRGYEQNILEKEKALTGNLELESLDIAEIERIKSIIRIGENSIKNTADERIYAWRSWGPTLGYFFENQQKTNDNTFSRYFYGWRSPGFQAMATHYAEVVPFIEVAPDKSSIDDALSSQNVEIQAAPILTFLKALTKAHTLMGMRADAHYFTAMVTGVDYLSASIEYKYGKIAEAIIDGTTPQAFMAEIKADKNQTRLLADTSEAEGLSIELAADKDHYEVGENVRLALTITNSSSNSYDDFSWWVFSPNSEFMEMDYVNLTANSVHEAEVEFVVENEEFHVVNANLATSDLVSVDDAFVTLSVGSAEQVAGNLNASLQDNYQPGEIEFEVVVENIGLAEMTAPVLIIDDQEIQLTGIAPGAEATEIITIWEEEPGRHVYELSLVDSKGNLLDAEVLWIEVTAIDELYAANKMGQYIYNPGEQITVTAAVMDGKWEETAIPYEVTITAPDGDMIEAAQFTPSLEGVYSVEIAPAPAESGYIKHKDSFNLVVGSPGNLVIHQEILADEIIEVTVTNEHEQPIADVEVSLGDESWFTDAGGEVVINRRYNQDFYIEARRFPYTMATAVALYYMEETSTEVGLYDAADGVFHLKEATPFRYGPRSSDWLPVAGDWNGDGNSSTGLYDHSDGVFHLADLEPFRFGPRNSGWLPVEGDWNGNGTESVGLYDPNDGVFHLKDIEPFRYGPRNSEWLPVSGDWNGDGICNVGLYDPADGVFHLEGVAPFRYGPRNSSWLPVTGDWNGAGTCSVGLYDPTDGVFHLKDKEPFRYGPRDSDWLPVSGRW